MSLTASTGFRSGATHRGRRTPAVGDPGLGGFLKDLGGAIVGGVTGLVTGGPIAAVTGALRGGGLIGGPSGGPGSGAVTPPVMAAPIQRPTTMPGGFFPGGFGPTLPPIIREPAGTAVNIGRQLGILEPQRVPSEAQAVGEATTTGMPGQCPGCPRGFRPNKSAYFLRDGTFVPERSKCVRSRRRDPLNPRALSRAMSRLTSAKRASRMMGRISIRNAKRCP